MRAIIVGAPIEVEGEPAEIAQLVELMTSGVVAVEHVHRFRLDEADDRGIQRGACWCGTERQYAPWGEQAPPALVADEPRKPKKAIAPARKKTVGQIVDAGRTRKCGNCGAAGHRADKCPDAAAA